MSPLTLALDQGGSSSRARVFDEDGLLVASAMRSVSTCRVGTDRVEHDPEETVASLRDAAEEAIGALGKRAHRVFAAGLACQRSSALCWRLPDGEPLSPVISWQDRRVGSVDIRQDHDDTRARTGLVPSPHYGAGKLRWCLDHLPEVRQAHADGTLAFGPLASYLAFRLLSTAPFVVDPACAQRTLLWNLTTGRWDPTLIERFAVDGVQLPTCVRSRGEFGDLMLSTGRIPLRVLTGDQGAALFSRGRPTSDVAHVNLGTGAFLLRVMQGVPESRQDLLTSAVFLEGGDWLTWAVEGAVNGAGAAVEVIASDLGLGDVSSKLEPWLRDVADPPLFLNGVSGLASPFWIPDFESRFVGEGDAPARIVGVLESVLFLLRMNLDAVAVAGLPLTRLLVGGGLSKVDALCQRLADLTGLEIVRSTETEATARGVAWCAGPRVRPVRAPEEETRFEPRRDPALEQRWVAWCAQMPSRLGSED